MATRPRSPIYSIHTRPRPIVASIVGLCKPSKGGVNKCLIIPRHVASNGINFQRWLRFRGTGCTSALNELVVPLPATYPDEWGEKLVAYAEVVRGDPKRTGNALAPLTLMAALVNVPFLSTFRSVKSTVMFVMFRKRQANRGGESLSRITTSVRTSFFAPGELLSQQTVESSFLAAVFSWT